MILNNHFLTFLCGEIVHHERVLACHWSAIWRQNWQEVDFLDLNGVLIGSECPRPNIPLGFVCSMLTSSGSRGTFLKLLQEVSNEHEIDEGICLF